MSVLWIKEETSNQHAWVCPTFLPLSLSSSLRSCLWLTITPFVAEMTPSLSLYLPLCLPLASWGRDWRLRPSIIGLTAGPRREWPCYLDSVMTSSKRGPSFPHTPGMAEVWFGASVPSLDVHRKPSTFTGCMCGSQQGEQYSGSKQAQGSMSCGTGNFLLPLLVFRSLEMKMVALVIKTEMKNTIILNALSEGVFI